MYVVIPSFIRSLSEMRSTMFGMLSLQESSRNWPYTEQEGPISSMIATSGISLCLSQKTKSHLQSIIRVSRLPSSHLGNFQGVTGQSGFRKGIRSGEGWKREVAAYLIDRRHLFSVPTTVQVVIPPC